MGRISSYIKAYIVAIAFFVCAASAAYGQKIVFSPQWAPQSQFAGYYVALEKGFYKEAGVDVEISHPSTSYSAINRLIDGSSNVVSLQLMQAISEVDKGVHLMNILQTSMHNGLVIVSRNDTIKNFADLKNKRVGIWQVGFGELGQIIDKEMQTNIQWVPFIQDINLFLSGAIDATLAMSYNEYLQIYAAGFEKNSVIKLSDQGYDIPEDGLYVTREFYNRFPKMVHAFAQASRRGWEWAHENPAETLEIVLATMKKHNIQVNRIYQEWMLQGVLSLQKDTPDGNPQFVLKDEAVQEAVEIMYKNGLIKRKISVQEIKGLE